METIVSQKMSRGQGNELLNKLEAAGLSDELAQRVIDSKSSELAVKVVRLIQNGGYEPSMSHKQARDIMGRNFFGVEEAIKHFGVNPLKQQLAYLAEVPFSEEVLKRHKDTHILVAVFPMSILDIRGKVKRYLFHAHEGAWYNEQAFAEDMGAIGWQLVRKVPIVNSSKKTWKEQQALLSKDEEAPKAQVVVYTIIGHFLATGERLFEKVYVRCLDLDSYRRHPYVGSFSDVGLWVIDCRDTERHDLLGLSAAMKI